MGRKIHFSCPIIRTIVFNFASSHFLYLLFFFLFQTNFASFNHPTELNHYSSLSKHLSVSFISFAVKYALMNLSYDVNLRQHGPLRKLHQKSLTNKTLLATLYFCILDFMIVTVLIFHQPTVMSRRKKAGLSIKKNNKNDNGLVKLKITNDVVREGGRSFKWEQLGP